MKASPKAGFDPSGPGLKNDNFIGLPYDADDAELILLPVPWDVTVSYREGTSAGPMNILKASTQLDLFDEKYQNVWAKGIYYLPQDERLKELNDSLRPLASQHIAALENGEEVDLPKLAQVNEGCEQMVRTVYEQTTNLLLRGKKVGLVGGDHSVPLGYYAALAEKYGHYHVLHIDAHMDLRKAYEAFEFSHASIFYNWMEYMPSHMGMSQIGIRDFCEEEWIYAKEKGIHLWTMRRLNDQLFEGQNWEELCWEIVNELPEKVYISLDIDGLDPMYCPNTGTPVPGGLSYNQVIKLLDVLFDSGKSIIGFDLVETAGPPHEYDANVAARLIYHMSMMLLSR